MGLRLKGLENTISLIGPDGPMYSVARIKSFDVTFEREILTEEYSGEVTPDFDDIDNGISASLLFHLSDPAVFDFVAMTGKRARREIPAGTQWQAVSTFNFPDNGRRRVIIPNLFFGPIPIKNDGRKAYVSGSISCKARTAYFKS